MPGATPAAEAAELAELDQDVQHFEANANDLRDQSRKIITYRYQKSRDMARAASELNLQNLEGRQRSLRSTAIDQFEHFLTAYPHAEHYTPDAIFRLSELYFERSYDDYSNQRQTYDKALSAWDADSGAPGPVEPILHYEPTIAQMQRLITDFPHYRLVDGAYYLMGFCLSEQGEEDRAVESFRELVARRPESHFAPEVWTRIGEYYFNNNQLDRALLAYAKVTENPESPFYDKALYKLAWTHYRLADPETAPEEFQKSVDAFVQLLDFNEQTKAAGAERGSDLRDESFQYIAISYAEERWGNLDKLRAYFKARGAKPYQRDVMMALGNTYFDQTRFVEAIKTYRSVMALDPNNREAPEAQDKLIAALDRQRDFTQAAQERDAMTHDYGEDSSWYALNRNNSDAIAKANKLIGKALYSAALFHHSQAQAFSTARRPSLALPEYIMAAKQYGAFLQRFPNDKQAYDLTFSYADCLYYAHKYEPAAAMFSAVRDSHDDNKLQEDAAFNVVLSYTGQIKQDEEAGLLKSMPLMKSQERPADANVKVQPLPPVKRDFVKASDRYAQILPRSERLPKVAYNAALIYYTYDQFDEARRRLNIIINAYPDNEVAQFSANLVIESYLSEKNYASVEEFTRRLLQSGKIKQQAFARELTKFKSGAIFKIADQLAHKGEHEKAADTYLKLINEDPQGTFADLALNNAALAYENVKRYDSASKMYERLVREYPRSRWADNALFRVGHNAEHFFDFSRAISAYLQLEAKYPRSEHRADAIYNAAASLENLQQYEKSSQEYLRYCKLFPHRSDAPAVCFRAGVVLEKTNAWPRVIETYGQFVRTFHNNATNRDRVLEAQLRTAKAYEKLQRPLLAKKFYQTVMTTAHGGKLDEKSAPYVAEAHFKINDAMFDEFRKLKIVGSTKAQKAGLLKKATELKKVEEAYGKVLAYKQLDWSLAALYRIGQLYENFAESLASSPCPPDVIKAGKSVGASSDEVCSEYRVLLEQRSGELEDKAVKHYAAVIDHARESQVANAWTKKTLEALNKLRRNEYPLQKDAKTFVDVLAMDLPPFVGAAKALQGPEVRL